MHFINTINFILLSVHGLISTVLFLLRLPRFCRPYSVMGISHSSENRCVNKPGCVFCNIIHGSERHRVIYEVSEVCTWGPTPIVRWAHPRMTPCPPIPQDENVVAFHDKEPSAAKHLLVVTKEHIPSVEDVSRTEAGLLEHMKRVGEQLLGERSAPSLHTVTHIVPSDGRRPSQVPTMPTTTASTCHRSTRYTTFICIACKSLSTRTTIGCGTLKGCSVSSGGGTWTRWSATSTAS